MGNKSQSYISNIGYRLAYGALYVLSLLPFKCLYMLSDCFYVIVYHVVKSRRKVVWRNLTTSFPDKSHDELKSIERRFYHCMCDYVVETIKLLSISDEDILKHIEFRNVEQMETYFDQGKDCAAILGHLCNWEWLSTTGLAFHRYPDAVMGLIYHPLRSHVTDRLMRSIRQSKQGVCIPKKDILRYLVTYKRENRRNLFGYIADQTPKTENIHLWLPFLNHDTPVFTGAERIMQKMDNAVFYVDMRRECRGKYTCTFKLITDTPAQCGQNEITKRFFVMLEESIRNQPECYLWSHNRWKRANLNKDNNNSIDKNKNQGNSNYSNDQSPQL